VKIKSELSEPFQVTKGLKQGDGLASMLFNLVLEFVIRQLKVDTNGTLQNKLVQITGYADDIGITGRTKSETIKTFN